MSAGPPPNRWAPNLQGGMPVGTAETELSTAWENHAAPRLLIVEDSRDDAELELRTLYRHGLTFSEVTVVDTEEQYRLRLADFRPDIILADYSLPGLRGERTLDLALSQCPQIPFIFVSGMLGEDRAVDLLKRGAWDYVLKDRLPRLGPAVRRSLLEATEREQLKQERQQAHDELQRSKEQLQAIIDTVQDALGVFGSVRDDSGTIVDFEWRYANPVAAHLLHRGREDVVGRTLLEVLPSMRESGLFDDFTNVTETGSPLSFLSPDLVQPHLDRAPTRIALKGRAAQLGDGFVVTYRDVTEQRLAAEQIAASEARLRATIDSLLDPCVLLAAARSTSSGIEDFVYTYANEAAHLYNDLPFDQPIGHRMLDLLPGRASPGLLDRWAAVVETGRPLILDNFGYRHELYGDEERRYDIRVAKVGDGISYTWRDVTDRHTAEQALRESEARFRGVVIALGEGILVQAADGTLLECNSAAERILGRSRASLIERTRLGHPPVELLRLDGSPLTRDDYPESLTLCTGKPCRDIVLGVDAGSEVDGDGRYRASGDRYRASGDGDGGHRASGDGDGDGDGDGEHRTNGDGEHRTNGDGDRAGGGRRWLLINAEPLVRPGQPSPYAVVTSLADITELRQTREDLETSEERFRLAFDDALIGMALIDIHVSPGLYPRVNRAMCDFLGYTEPELLSRPGRGGLPRRAPLPRRGVARTGRCRAAQLPGRASLPARLGSHRVGAAQHVTRPRPRRPPDVRLGSRRGHHRPQAGRGGTGPPGHARRPDRPAQPGPAAGPPARRLGPRAARPVACSASCSSISTTSSRSTTASDMSPATSSWCNVAERITGSLRRDRHRGADRRRRVRRRLREPHRSRGRRRRRPPDPARPRPDIQLSRAAGQRPGRASGSRSATTQHPGDPAARRRRRDVRRQAPGRSTVGARRRVAARRRDADALRREPNCATRLEQGQLRLHYQPTFDLQTGAPGGGRGPAAVGAPRPGAAVCRHSSSTSPSGAA